MPFKDKNKESENKRIYYLKHKEYMKSEFKKNYFKNREERLLKSSQYWINNKELVKQKRREYERKLKLIIYNELGNKCNCCGESIIRFLTIDHINGGGAKHRKSVGGSGLRMYYDIIKRGIPKDEFQILCFNCNSGRYLNGGICPHKFINQ